MSKSKQAQLRSGDTSRADARVQARNEARRRDQGSASVVFDGIEHLGDKIVAAGLTETTDLLPEAGSSRRPQSELDVAPTKKRVRLTRQKR